MRIALINPPVTGRYVHSIDEPLGILYLTAQLKEQHEVLIIDSFTHCLSVTETVELCLDSDVDIVGISSVFSTVFSTTKEICQQIKTRAPQVVTILGGNTATFMKDDLLRLPWVDFVVRGEGDRSFPNLIEAIESGKGFGALRGISYLKDGNIIHQPHEPLIKNLDELPFPARELLPMSDKYPKTILSSRGCAYGCPYCSTAAFWGKGFRCRSVDNIIDEIHSILGADQVDYFSFADDCFTLIPERAKEIAGRINEMDCDLTWSCTGRIETIDQSLLEAFSSSGCSSIFFGIESGCDKTLKLLKRRYDKADVLKVYNLCLDYGIQPYFSFIMGLPFESVSDIEQTYELISALKGVESGIHILTPFPGTPLVEHPEDYGLEILPHAIEEIDLNTRSYIKTSELTPREIEAAYRKAVGYSFKALKQKAGRRMYE